MSIAKSLPLSIMLITAACSCSPRAGAPQWSGVTVGEPLRLTFGAMTIIRDACLFTDDGQIWVFAHVVDEGRNRLVCRRFDGQRWSALGDVTDLGDLRGPAQIAFAPGASRSGGLFLLWSVRDYSSQEAKIKASAWDGKSWAAPKDTPGLMSAGGTSGLVVWQAKPDILAAMYTGTLRPPESYSVGVDGWFPVKPFYMELADHAWSKPSAMASPSRWRYMDLAIVAGKGKNQVLAVAKYADRLWIHASQLEYGLVTEGGQWSARSRIKDPEGNVHSPSGSVDAAGVLHVVYDVVSRSKQRRVTHYRTKEGDKWSRPRSLGAAGHDGAVGGDPKGNVYIYWVEGSKTAVAEGAEDHTPEVGYVRVVSDGRESVPTKVQPLDEGRIYPASGARVFLVGKSNPTTIIIQEVKLPPD